MATNLHLFSFKTLSVAALAATITKWADLSEEGDADYGCGRSQQLKHWKCEMV